ncbi:hypothetical protein CRE_27798 [Caenorhabditis remanei]|uniref:DUF281 domain-containing protein n=1 Tax=Caenorhabditis remanei TaxID=31234 RepID=E3N5I9_CAERE|nr:hypothetical protein CRE_27798 [Caenorhabditis remanei]
MNYLLFFLLISLVNCKGCKDQCECPDLLDRLNWPERSDILYTEEAGCFRNITCLTYKWSWVRFNYNETEITRPVNATYWGVAETIDTTKPAEPQKSIVNLFEFFGMICENNDWYITKYPYGFSYVQSNGTGTYVYLMKNNNEELDGKKSKILVWNCMPPSWCECPGLLDKFKGDDNSSVLYTEEDGCVINITCKASYNSTFVGFNFTDSEIPRPADIADNYGAALTVGDQQPNLSDINLFEYFGMICENQEWYITKYPSGVRYGNATGVFVIGSNGEFDGKKTKINYFSCVTPPK